MKLEKYLADYICHEIELAHEQGLPMDYTAEGLQEIIKQGLDAFESTENARINIQFEDITCEHSFVDGVIADEGEEECRFCGFRRKK